MSPLTIYAVGILGSWILQDSLASIAFYNSKEKWFWNHTFRLVRGLLGLALMIIAGILIGE